MSTGTRVLLAQGRAAAEVVREALTSACERIEIAGSIRRNAANVGDIELVAVPIIEEESDGMFGTASVNRLTERVDALIELGFLASHPTDSKRGERYSKVVHALTGLQVDLFSATRETFGVIFLIRTGPATFSHRFVTQIRHRGFHVADGALHRGGLGCGTYVCDVIPTPEERDVFGNVDWTYIQPEFRR